MKRSLRLVGAVIAALALTLAAAPAFAQRITGIVLYPAVAQFEFTDCASGGSAAQTVTKGTYLFRVTTEDVWICYAATCATGGMKFSSGIAFMLSVEASAGQSVSCRSASSTGDAIFTRATTP